MANKTNPFKLLQDFVNVKDQTEACAFRDRYPGFLPDNDESLIPFRERLSSLWRSADPTVLGQLLGISPETAAATDGGASDLAVPQAHAAVGPGCQVDWQFRLGVQRSLYELFCGGEQWRVMTCHVCGNPFVATKTAQKHCSPECSLRFKRQRALVSKERGKLRKQKLAARRRQSHGK